MLHRIAAATGGVGAAAVASWGVLTSLGGLDVLTLRRNFISDLATPWNPYAERLNTSLQIAGALVVLMALAVGVRARTRLGRVASAATVVGGVCLALVGVYPVTRLTPHLVVAIALGAAAVVAAVAAAVAARRATRDQPALRWVGGAALACTWAVLAVLGAGLVYFVWVSARVWPGSVGELMAVLPRALPVRVGGEVYNPLAVAEWLFFALLCAQMVGFAVAEAVGIGDRVRA